MPYIVIEVTPPEQEPFWTLVETSTGRDLRAEHRFAEKHQAEAVANSLNGVEIEE
jgi:hypothetical protein